MQLKEKTRQESTKLSEIKNYSNFSIIFTVISLISLLSNYWLLKGIMTGKVIYVYGTLPIQQPWPFNPLSAWNSFLSTQRVIPPSNLVAYTYSLGPNIAWIFHEIILPIIGGVFMYLLLRAVIVICRGSKSFSITAPTVTGIFFELVLLSRYTDKWIKAPLAITPAVPFFSLIFFEAVNKKQWRKATAFALLTVLFLSALYDWRLQISGIALILVFSLGLFSFSLIVKMLKEKKFWIIASASFFVWCTLWLIPHVYGVYLYSLSFTRSVTLPVIVGNYQLPAVYSLYSAYFIDKILRILYFFIVCIAFSSLLMFRKHPLSKFVLTASIVIISITLIIWDQSPLKSVHYFLVSLSLGRFDIGVLFRTHKIFTGMVLPLTIVLFGLSVHYACLKMTKKKVKAVYLFLLFLLIGSIGWRVIEINNNENKVTVIPDEYFKVANRLHENMDSYRVLWLPRTGKYPPGENPVWFKTTGWGVPETTLGLRTYFYYGKPMEYLYPFIMRLIENNETKATAYILSDIGVKYVALHDDYWWKRLQQWVRIARENLEKSPYFKLVYSTEHIYIYENRLAGRSVHIGMTPILIDGGLKTLADLIERSDTNFSRCSFYFTDLPIPKEAIYSAPLIATYSAENLRFNLLTNLLISGKKENYIIIPTQFTKGIEKGKWHPFFIDNPHHAVWEVFYTWNFPDARFEHSFKFYWGFVGSRNPGDYLKIPINVKKIGDYVLLVRYFENIKGGKIELSIDNKTFNLTTRGRENAFTWFDTNVTFSKRSNILVIKNFKGLNAINIIIVIPKDEFTKFYNEINEILKSKKIITFNLVKNPSFVEMLDGLPKNWKLGNTNFKISFDIGYSGMHSLKVSTNTRKEKSWSWIVSEPISVVPGRKYLIITHMKAYNVRGSHITIIGYYPNGYHPEIAQVPSGVSGTFDWREYSCILEIPRNITKIRIALNAGWVLDPSKGPAITWFDDIKVIPIDNILKLENIGLSNHYRTFRIAKMEYKNGKYIIDIRTYDQNTSFSVTIPEQYHGGWEAIVDGKTIVKSSPQLFVNNFWIKLNRPGNNHIEITFYPQTTWHIIYLVNLATILAITIIGCYIYVINLKTKNPK